MVIANIAIKPTSQKRWQITWGIESHFSPWTPGGTTFQHEGKSLCISSMCVIEYLFAKCCIVYSLLRVSLGIPFNVWSKIICLTLEWQRGRTEVSVLTHYILSQITQGSPNVEKPLLSLFTKSLFTHSHRGLRLNCLSFVPVCAEYPHSHLSQSCDHEDTFVSSSRTNWFRTVALNFLVSREKLHCVRSIWKTRLFLYIYHSFTKRYL